MELIIPETDGFQKSQTFIYDLLCTRKRRTVSVCDPCMGADTNLKHIWLSPRTRFEDLGDLCGDLGGTTTSDMLEERQAVEFHRRRSPPVHVQELVPCFNLPSRAKLVMTNIPRVSPGRFSVQSKFGLQRTDGPVRRTVL